MSEEVLEEIEALTAILDEDTVEILSKDAGPAEISIKITPLTASEQEKQYVSLTLVVSLSDGEFSHSQSLSSDFNNLPSSGQATPVFPLVLT